MRRLSVLLTLLVAAIIMAACDAGFGAAPTPEPWTPPPTLTPEPTEAADAAPTAVPEPTEASARTVEVQRGDVAQTLQLDGRVVPVALRDLSLSQDGVVEALYVERGSTFTRGELLAELDMGDLLDQLTQAQTEYEKSTFALDAASREIEFPVRRAELDLDAARTRLERLQQSPDPEQVRRARAVVQQAQANLDKVRNDASAIKNQAEQALRQAERALILAQDAYSKAYHDAQTSDDPAAQSRLAETADDLRAAESDVARLQIEYDTARGNEIAAVQSAQAQLEIAQADLDELLEGPDPVALADARQAVRVAELALDEARQRARLDPELTARVEAAQRNITAIEKNIEARRLYAPFDGEVVAIAVAPGASVLAFDPIMTVLDATADRSQMEVRVPAVNIQDASNISSGQAVEVTLSRYPDQVFNGTISQLPLSGTSTGATVTDGSYHISIDEAGVVLEENDSAQVLVTVKKSTNALWLPAEAVRFDNRYFVITQEGDEQQRVDIQVGIITPERIEITAGLNEGAVVVVQ